eukprot:GSChrysophyteH2.ASY1.ANO1.84.1 assembled CDS
MIKKKFLDDMVTEQSMFVKFLTELDVSVTELSTFTDLKDVSVIAERVKDVETNLKEATEKAKLFNSREVLFENDTTEYEDLARITKQFEPFLSLWETAKSWTDVISSWRTEQISAFQPEVPLIVCLRNPGMRDRHWETLAKEFKVDIMPIEDFTTDQILALNLKDQIEKVQKIGESAAKEYQIEQALDKMEKEWENMYIMIHAYRDTGTGVLKGVDDINVILDEQITMTQTIMFSAFKGPFEERIEEWNRKLCCVSEVLDAWVAVQRNWLYLQPIFESADINRQLPTEGKKFSTVIDFCDNEKLLERWKESEILLDQVQKGLSDYLETKRSGIDKVRFLKDLKIDRIISPEGEEVMLSEMIDPVEKNVEHWMLELEMAMRVCITDVMESAVLDYSVTARPRWMQKWPGMCVLNGSQMHWTTEMEDFFRNDGVNGPKLMLAAQVAQLADMTILVRGKLSNSARTTVGALTVIDVHARDVIKKLAETDMKYGYEYLGNSFRLVITPLTDKCYLTLMGALQMIFGGAPAGPAGTGKTETTKDLAKALAMQCVVFNCSDGLDYLAMGKFFKGLAACGAWACFDEFNRINIEVLSVIGQQIMSIQNVVKLSGGENSRMTFEGSDILVSPKFAVFITMNPGYAGRTALPDSLSALFRPVAMMVPDYALIGEIMFFAYGFELAKECGAKMVTTFKLCSEQLSSQPHYDYGMRAVKTVITAAGNLKRAEPECDEYVLLLRALQDIRPEMNYGPLMRNMKNEIRKSGKQILPWFTDKVIQLYEMIVVRHGLMVVGPTGGGKSSNIKTLQATLGALRDQNVEGFAYEHVIINQLNPKSITMGQMYGEVDSNTMEWKDGIMSTMYRSATIDTPERKWMLFDGPVDAIWIENMNTVLDDNKKLCLNSGEIIKMSPEMTMMFEVEDLTVASPATVSRVGIIFMEPKGLGLDVLLFDAYLSAAMAFLRSYFDLMIADLVTTIEPLFMFALVWSVGATTNAAGRVRFDGWLRSEMHAQKSGWVFPKEGTVYDYLFLLESKKWGSWMGITDKYEIDGKANFSEIIVPTKDSVRNTFLIDLLMPAGKHMLLVGESGTGKTINISQYLMGTSVKVQGRSISPNAVPLTLTFSANTSANMTQDQLDSKMDKRRKGVYGPPAGKKFYIYVDDLNMPKRETYGAQPPIELLRQWWSQGGWYDRKELVYKSLIDLVFIASMGPPGGGKQEITPRGLTTMTEKIVHASIDVFDTIVEVLLPTPSKSHYTFNLRDLAKIFQGMLMVDPKKMNAKTQLARLWVHEVKRVFGDRLTVHEDHEWLKNVMKGKVEKEFELEWDEVCPDDRMMFGDFMFPDSEAKIYEEIESMEKLKTTVEEYLLEHNAESKQPMPLVMFSDALEHVARIARVIRQPMGNALLLGVGGSGRQSMTKLACYICGFKLANVEIVKGYSMNDWREDLRRILMQAGVKNEVTTFLFSDIQIIDERMRKLPATKLNIFSQYIARVRKNLHLCVCMSPLGEIFRNRLRNFPALVNSCTIDWFTNWPAEALQSLNTVNMFKLIHLTVETKSVEFFESLRRRNYVTPTSYLELLAAFGKLLGEKRTQIKTKRDRLQIGLDKLSETKKMVSVMQEELVILQPQLVKTQQEVASMMVIIAKDKASAAETKAIVEVEEAKANEKAAQSKAIADDAQADLDKALPALEEAVKCLNDLKKADIDEVKSLKTPPSGVVLTVKAVCIMFAIEDYWEAGKKELLSDAKVFMESLFKFDKDHIPDKVIQGIQPLIDDPAFTPQMIEKASKACTAVCMWARAMHTYHFVALGVAPKRAALAEAEGELAEEGQCKNQLVNADKLIGGLGGEEIRWTESVVTLGEALTNVLGDIIVCGGAVSYLGVFTAEFRSDLISEWQTALVKLKIPHTPNANLESVLGDPVKLRSWQLCNLPSDSLSTQNGIIMDNSHINFAPNGMDVVKQSDKNFLRTLENGVQFGRWVLLENIGETLDAALEPVLLQQKFKQGGQDMIKLGDNVVPYNDQFRFFLTTKLANPHYTPEVQVKVSLVNFTITQGGLEEQLLHVVVGEELPELATQRANLVIDNAARNKQLFDIESEILYLLSNSTGNILDDTVLIETLAQSKVTSGEIKVALEEADEIENEIIQQSEHYRPVGKRASLIYFVIADLGFVDPMYQYSLQWFTILFVRGIQAAATANEVEQRVLNLNDFFTNSVYNNICRSLFERHKLLFSFILTVKILQGDNNVDAREYRFLLSGICGSNVSEPLPSSEKGWLAQNIFDELNEMSGLPGLASVAKEFKNYIGEWQEIYESSDPHKKDFPPPCENITPLQKLCILRCLRRDKVDLCMQDYVQFYLDHRFITPPPFDLKACYADSTNVIPVIFILSTGSDPGKDLDTLAGSMDMLERTHKIALGQGQGKKAQALLDKLIVEGMDAGKIHSEFRLWLTSMPSEAFPRSILQNGIKLTKEPPKGIRANLKNTYLKLSNDGIQATNKPAEYMKLLFGLSFFHAIVVERKKYGPLGWNIPYEFNDTDRDITIAQLELYVDAYEHIPYKDMRTADIIVADFLQPQILESGHKFSKSGLYYSLEPNKDAPHDSYIEYIDQMPLNAEPEVFGMHENANITSAITSTNDTFEIILSLQPRVSAGAGISREDQISETAVAFHAQLGQPFDLEAIAMQYPTDYYESMNTVLVQEAERYNNLLVVLHETLRLLPLALKGLVVLSAELEAMATAVFDQRVPVTWTNKAYPSLKPLNAWFKDLVERLKFIQTWIDEGVPPSYWISGFFFPQGFLTAILQNFARKYAQPIDTVAFSFIMRPEDPKDLPGKPEDGCYIFGIFLEGARWSEEDRSLVDPRPKELFASCPVIHMMPVQHRVTPTEGIYRCPLYKVLTRTGVLSTTGHSTNFVTWLELPSLYCDNADWVRGGVAAFCALRF